jgi:Protein of unknown function (DUF2917)
MKLQLALESQQSDSESKSKLEADLQRLGPVGSWVLPAGHALTLHSHEARALRVTQGRVWATLDGPHAGPGNDRGDMVLQAGEHLNLQAGQRVVIEPLSDHNTGARTCANDSAYFSLEPAAQSAA